MNNKIEPHDSNRETGSQPTRENTERSGQRDEQQAGQQDEQRDEQWSGQQSGQRGGQQGSQQGSQRGSQRGNQKSREPTNAVAGQSALGWPAVFWIVLLLGALGGLVYLHYQPVPTGSVWLLLPADSRAEIMRHLPGILGALALLMLLGLLWGIRRRARRRYYDNFRRTRQAGYTAGGLLEELQAITGEAAGAADGGDNPIAQWRAGNAAQTEELGHAAREISGVAAAIGRIGVSASKSTERARYSAEAAKKGAVAVHDTVASLSATRSRIQEAAEQLKQLGESLRRIDASVNLIRDTTEQTGVLSLNTALQAATAGEAGRGFAVAADEVRRLADHSARGAGEIAELARVIQSGAGSVIESMQATAEEVAAGATLADEVGRALTEIQNAGRDLLEMIDLSATVAAGEATRAQSLGEKMEQLKTAAEQSGTNVSRIMERIEKINTMAFRLDESISGTRVPGR